MRQGENLSPLLFALFLDDFDDAISKKFNGIDACKLYNTDENITFIKLYSLLYADDTLILAENETELQHGLTAVYNYCVDDKLKANPIK